MSALYKGQVSIDPKKEAFASFMRGVVPFVDPYIVGDDDLANQWTESNAAGGTTKRGARSKVLMNTSAGAGGVALLFWGSNRNASGFPLWFPNGATSKFGVEARLRLTTVVTAADEICMGDAAEWLMGVRGASSTGFWVARFSNGPTLMTSAIPIDNGVFHRFRLWRDGTTTFFQVDNETPVSSLNAFATNEERFQFRAYNGGAANIREMEPDYAYLMADRT